MMKKKIKHYREYHELPEIERMQIRQAFKLDYQGYRFIDRYLISREAFRELKEQSRL
ncbi:hypothetical protein VAA96_004531 [Salmonella enterica]|nr:hypothetical protein [Salmonella enterica]